MDNLKVCCKCCKTKSQMEFYSRKNGRKEIACKSCRLLTQKNRYENNPTKGQEYALRWREKHPLILKIIGLRRGNKSIKGLKLLPQLESMYREHPYCEYCHAALSAKDVSLDHNIPVSRGGDPCDPGNWTICCWGCNRLKWTMTANEFKTFIKEYAERIAGQYRAKSEKSERCNDQGINPASAPRPDQGLRYDLSHSVTNGSSGEMPER